MRMTIRTTGVVVYGALMVVLMLGAPASAQVPDFATIDVPGASFTLLRGVNSEGDIVGFYGAPRLDATGRFSVAVAPGEIRLTLAAPRVRDGARA
jgi:hypothetical protein